MYHVRMDRQGYFYKPLPSIIEHDCGYFTYESASQFLRQFKLIHTQNECIKLCSEYRLSIESMGLHCFKHGVDPILKCGLIRDRLINKFGNQIEIHDLSVQVNNIKL